MDSLKKGLLSFRGVNWVIPYSEVKTNLAFQLGHTLFRSKKKFSQKCHTQTHQQNTALGHSTKKETAIATSQQSISLGSVLRETVHLCNKKKLLTVLHHVHKFGPTSTTNMPATKSNIRIFI